LSQADSSQGQMSVSTSGKKKQKRKWPSTKWREVKS